MLPRRIAVVAALAAAAALMLTGCSGSGSGPGADSNALTFWAYEPNSMAQKNALDKLISGFEKTHKIDVKVTYVPKDGFNTKIDSSIAAGRNPDVSYLDQPLVPKFAQDGLLLDVTKQLNAGLGTDSFYPGAMNTNVIDGRVYGLPLSMTTVALFYNKAMVSTPPADWDAWEASARKTYVPNKVAAFAGIGSGGYGAWIFPALVQSAGGTMVNSDQTAATFGARPGVDAADLLVTLQKYSDQAVRESQNAFGNGNVAYEISGPWDVEALKTNFPHLDFGIAPIPAEAGHQSSSVIGGENLVVYKNSTKAKLAYEFVEYLTNADGDAAMAGVTGDFAANVKAAEALGYANDPYLGPFAKQLETAVARPTLTDWLKVNDEVVGKALDDILVTGADPAKVLPQAQKTADSVLFPQS